MTITTGSRVRWRGLLGTVGAVDTRTPLLATSPLAYVTFDDVSKFPPWMNTTWVRVSELEEVSDERFTDWTDSTVQKGLPQE